MGKKVCLIACPWVFFNEVEFLSQQLGLGYVGAYAEQFGHEIVAFIDPMVDGGGAEKEKIVTKQKIAFRFGLSDEKIINLIPQNTDVIGINAPFTDSRLVLYPLVRKIKTAFPDKIVVVGGVLPTTLPEEVIRESGADIAVRGEGEVAFLRILNGEKWEEIPGVVFCRNNKIFHTTPLAERILDVNNLPLPGYHLRPMDKYMKLSTWGNRADKTLHLISSRGCPFNCHFCAAPQKAQKWRAFSAERILDEIKMAIQQWDINFIEFADDNFTFNAERAKKILRGIIEFRDRGHDLRCAFPNGIMIEKIDKELPNLFKNAGTEVLYLPIESGDPKVLLAMNKPNTLKHLEQSIRVAELCVEIGLFFGCFLIVAYPGGKVINKNKLKDIDSRDIICNNSSGIYIKGEDEESFEKTYKFCERLRQIGAKGITPLIATPLPGTPLYDFCKRFGFLVFEDYSDSLVTVSYADVTPDVVQIQTPWCSKERAYERWKILMDSFDTYHNVRKFDGLDKNEILSGCQMRDLKVH